MRLVCGDALEELAKLPDRSVDLVLADPPYNVGVQTIKNGRKTTCQWDRIDGYADWFLGWVKECQRVLKPNGVFYFFHNNMAQIAELMERIKRETEFVFVSFCIWDKGEAYRARTWRDRDPEGKTALRSWFNRCEYCLHYRCDKDHCNVWRVPPIPSTGRYHTCQKPLEILERIIRVSCRPGGTVLDPFMGSGSTGVACLHTGREFIGIERDRDTYCTATERVEREKSQMRWEV